MMGQIGLPSINKLELGRRFSSATHQNTKMKKLLLTITTLTFLVTLGLVLHYNFRIHLVKSGSMEPEINKGDLIITGGKDHYQIGDIITFQHDQGRVTHQIAAIQTRNSITSFQTKGLANSAADKELVKLSDVIGVVRFVIPKLGVILLLQEKYYVVAAVWVISLLIIVLEIQELVAKLKGAGA